MDSLQEAGVFPNGQGHRDLSDMLRRREVEFFEVFYHLKASRRGIQSKSAGIGLKFCRTTKKPGCLIGGPAIPTPFQRLDARLQLP
jgi:hypothetical protein